MEVILLEKIRNLGKLGDTVNVRPGYGRNFLVPTGKAIPATAANRKVFESRRVELEKTQANALSQAEKRAAAIEGLGLISLAVRAAEEGKLYGSVASHDIVELLAKSGVTIEKSEVLLPNGPVRHVGDYEIAIQLHTDVTSILKLQVVAE